jgi:hypothetical protein
MRVRRFAFGVLLGCLVGCGATAVSVHAQAITQTGIRRVEIDRSCTVRVRMGFRSSEAAVDAVLGEGSVVLHGTRPGCSNVATWLNSGFTIDRIEGVWPEGVALPWPLATSDAGTP